MHIPIMVEEIVSDLVVNKNGVYIDATFGFGGHSKAMLSELGVMGKLIGIDRDIDALNLSDVLDPRLLKIKANFADLDALLFLENLKDVDGILADIGLSSFQIDRSERGFSYVNEGPLDMRMDRSSSKDAKLVVNSYGEERLADIIYLYGEDRFSRKIAKAIIKKRYVKSFETTKELSDCVMNATRSIDSVKRVFQAIRIEVNNELSNLETFLKKASSCLKINGRVAIITFHSLEDRIVKNYFKNSNLKQIYKKAMIPTKEEMDLNSRSKSAKLRIAERVI